MLYDLVVKAWKEGDKEELLNSFFPKFVYCSNKIENDETIFADVKAIFYGEKVTGFKRNMKTIKEIKNHKEVCERLLQLRDGNNSKLSTDFIKKLHYDLMKDCFSEELLSRSEKPGELKKGWYVVGLNEIGADPSEVEKKLISLIKEINEVEINENNALKVVSYGHCVFEQVHPFADGNGRVGRILLNYLLILNNLPPIVLFEADREEYYLALEYFNLNQEIDKMVEFLDNQAYKTWGKYIQKL